MATVPRDPVNGFEYRRAAQRVRADGFLEARNADMFGLGSVTKRRGYFGASNLDLSDTALPGQLQGVGYLSDELLRIQNDDLYGYTESRDRWHKLGPWKPVVTSETVRVTRARTIFSGDFAELDGFRALIWVEVEVSSGTFRVFASVETTKCTTVIPPFQLATSESQQLLQPRAVASGSWISLSYWTSVDTEWVVHRWQPDLATTISAPAQYLTLRGYDLLGVPDRNEVWIARQLATPKLTEIRPDLTTNRDRNLPGATPILALDRWEPTQEILIGQLDSATGASSAEWFDDALNSINTYAPAVDSVRITVVITDATTGYLFTERLMGAGVTFGIEPSVLDRNGAATTPVTTWRGFGVGLAGRAVAIDGEAYVLTIYVDDQQGGGEVGGDDSDTAYFGLRGRDLAIISRSWNHGQAVQWGSAAPTAPEFNLQGAVLRDVGWTWPTTARTDWEVRILEVQGFEPTGGKVLGEVEHNVSEARAKLLEASGIATWAVGGFLRGCDCARTWEVDYHVRPRIVGAQDTGAVGNMAPGTYLYAVNALWRDKQGRRYRSLLATFQFVLAAGQGVDLEIQCIRVTERDDIQFEVWRSVDSESSPLYLVSEPGIPVENSQQQVSIVYRDGLNDSDLPGREELEQSPIGARLAFDSMGATGFAALAGDRVWFRSPQNTEQAYASQLPVLGDGIHLSSLLFVELDTEEEFMALADQDGAFYGLSRTTVSVWSGRGPENNSTGNAWPPTQAIPTMEGCSLFGGISRSAQGLIYATSDGPAPLARDQTAGGPVAPIAELYADTGQTVTDLVHVQLENEFWVLDAGDINIEPERGTVSYSTQTQRWSQHTLMQAVIGAASQRGAFAVARTDGRVLIRDGSRWDTADVDTAMTLTPGWQRPQPSMLAPYACQAIGLTLIYYSEHRLLIDILADDDLDHIVGTVTVYPNLKEIRVGVEWGDVTPFATWGQKSSQRFGALQRPGRSYTVKLQLQGTHASSITCRMRDADGAGPAWGYVQMVTSWRSRPGIDKTDVLCDESRTYTLELV